MQEETKKNGKKEKYWNMQERGLKRKKLLYNITSGILRA